ncbi:MAG: ChaN family lipoprotein [Hyphomicrobiaceae bacterium]
MLMQPSPSPTPKPWSRANRVIARVAGAVGLALLIGPVSAVAQGPVAGEQGSEPMAVDRTIMPELCTRTGLSLMQSGLVGGALDGPAWSRVFLRDPSDGRLAPATTADQVVQLLRSVDVILLGEVHDNPLHHVLQACLLGAVADLKPALLWEHIDSEQAEALAAYLAEPGANAAGLGTAIAWHERGWPAWAIYQPIAEVALREGLAMAGANAPRPLVREVARQGLGALDPVIVAGLKLDQPMPEPLEAALIEELVESHCGLMPAQAFATMKHAQRFRDAHMAKAILDAKAEHQRVVLVTGNGHARDDRGVPFDLRRLHPGLSIASAVLTEGSDVLDTADPVAKPPKTPDGRVAAEVVIVTPAARRDDPCEEMRRMFERRRAQ